MKHLFIIAFLLLFTLPAFTQNFEVPANYEMKKADDYAKYEADVLKAIDWLMNTPVDKEKAKRKQVNAFIITWISGSPDVTIEVTADIVTFMEPNAELLMIFMCGWTKYALETKNYKDMVNGNLKGVEAVIDFYTKNKAALQEDKNVEKYIKMKEKGKLEEFIKGKVK